MTAALEGGEWSAARPGFNLPQGKTRYPLYRRLGGPQSWSGRAENLVPTGIRTRNVHPVVSRYTDWATGPAIVSKSNVLKCILRIEMNYVQIQFSETAQRIWKEKLKFCVDKTPDLIT